MRAKRLTAQLQQKLLKDFCEEHGAEQIKASYGWTNGYPRASFRGERSWSFHVADKRVGWGSILLDLAEGTDDEATLIVGVFPAHQQRGYRVAILDWLCEKAKKLGADTAAMSVKKSNEAHYNRTIRESHTPGSPWKYAGDVWFPEPGYGYFVRPLHEEKAS
jgi:GNAT superfamily N-acetyltransferase